MRAAVSALALTPQIRHMRHMNDSLETPEKPKASKPSQWLELVPLLVFFLLYQF